MKRLIDIKYVTLLSTSYAGSTLLSMILCSNPEIIGFGDTYPMMGENYDDKYCQCGSKILNCPLRKEIEGRMREAGFPNYTWVKTRPYPGHFFYQRYRKSSLVKKAFDLAKKAPYPIKYYVLFNRFYRETLAYLNVLKDMGYSLYFDGSKVVNRFYYLSPLIGNIKIIHLIRDPRAYIHSYLYKRNRPGDFKDILASWIGYNQQVISFRNLVGEDNYFLVHYEDLASDSHRTMRRIYNFIGVGIADRDVTEVMKDRLHIMGNRMRLSFKNIEDKSREWEGKLDDEILQFVQNKIKKLSWYNLPG